MSTLWTPGGSTPPSTGSKVLDPFAGNQLKMSAQLFQDALNVLQAPVGTPGRQGLDDMRYAAAMVVDLREDALASAVGSGRNGKNPPTHFFCPTCDQAMIEDAMNQQILCTKCSRGVSVSMLHRLFLASTPVAPGSSIRYTTPPGAPKVRTPGLTSALSDNEQPDFSKLKADKVETKEPVVMWRAWKIDLSSKTPELLSSMDSAPWPAKEPLKANHKGKPCDKGETPNWHCMCGAYGVKTLRQAQAWAHGGGKLIQVIGKVAMWGTVHHYTEGARSSLAYPKEIWIPSGEHHEEAARAYEHHGWTAERLRDTLAAHYGVEVHLEDGFFDLSFS